jgi:hypothetical protein
MPQDSELLTHSEDQTTGPAPSPAGGADDGQPPGDDKPEEAARGVEHHQPEGTAQQSQSSNDRDAADEADIAAEMPASAFPRPRVLAGTIPFIWYEERPAVDNYVRLAQRLAEAGDLYRTPQHGGGLMLASEGPAVPPTPITTAQALAAIIVDRIQVSVRKGGEARSYRIPSGDLTTMLRAEVFLQNFRAIDMVTKAPIYMPDFSLTAPGYNDGGPGAHVFYAGELIKVSDSRETIDQFLNAIPFASEADRTNALGAALLTMCRHHWPGAKPIIPVTSSKSHGAKGTVVDFIAGEGSVATVDYQPTNWAMERAFVGTVKTNPEAAVYNVDNGRICRGERRIASAFLERISTDPQPTLFSTGTGPPLRRHNDFIICITTNEGTLSSDLMNRALPIRLEPTGNVEDRIAKLGNLRLDFLPANRHKLAAEVRAMVGRWKAAGCPLDQTLHHPFTPCMRTIGGILQVSGYRGFLQNYTTRRAIDDPVRRAIGILGAAQPAPDGSDQGWATAGIWAVRVVELGLTKMLIGDLERDSEKGRERAMGVVLSAHRDELLTVETDDERLTLRLERARRRFNGGEPCTRYRFVVVKREPIPADDDPPADAATNAPAIQMPGHE